MATKIEIYNMALGHIGVKPISGTAVPSPAHIALDTHYDSLRKSVLEDYDWPFAERRERAVRLSEVQTIGYQNSYAYPADCIKIRRLYKDGAVEEDIKYTITANSDMTARTILTDYDDIYIIYTGDVSNVGAFPPGFLLALAWRLSSVIAYPITKKASIARYAQATYADLINQVKVNSARESSEVLTREIDFISARGL